MKICYEKTKTSFALHFLRFSKNYACLGVEKEIQKKCEKMLGVVKKNQQCYICLDEKTTLAV